MARSKTSQTWLKEHFDDVYVKRAQQEGYRSRAVYKLLEINKKDQLLKPGMTVIDLGAAPGSWCQVAADIVTTNARAQNAKAQKDGRVIALDILPMDPLPDVDIILGDFREDEVLAELLAKVGHNKVDLVMSDMAPNISRERSVDGPR
ncbi:MAG: 23S rRNA methyltransferase, partial [Gammaproteobacteria bacterium]|nr:23S rRNA methyltransferase [Gammaproteobacteria bacterium]